MRKALLASLLASLLGSCAVSPVALAPGGYVGAYPLTGNPVGVPMSIDVDATRALASLPPAAGPVLSVRETRHANGLTQDIVLGSRQATPGENAIYLTELTPPDPAWRGNMEGDVKLGKITDAAIQADLDKRFPGVPMQISANYEGTPQGPLGYATGKSGGVTCLYAWQNITPPRPLTLVEGAMGLGDYPISVRVRLCKATSESNLVDLVRHLAVVRPGYGAVYAPAMSAPVGGDALAAAGARPPPTQTVSYPPYAYAGPIYGAAPYGPMMASSAVVPAPVMMQGATGGPVVVGGPVIATPFGIVAAAPALSGTDPGLTPPLVVPAASYGMVPVYNAPWTMGVADAAVAPAYGHRLRVAGARGRRTRFVARRVTPAMLEDRVSGPIVPLPGDVAPPPVAPAAAPRAPVKMPPAAAGDALPMPK